MKDDSMLSDTLQRLQTEVTSTPSIVGDVMQRIEQKPMPVRCRRSSRTNVVAVCTATTACLAVAIGVWAGVGDRGPAKVASTRGNQAAVAREDEGAGLTGMQGIQQAESQGARDATPARGTTSARGVLRLGVLPTRGPDTAQIRGLQSAHARSLPAASVSPTDSGNTSLGSANKQAPWGGAVDDVQCRLLPWKSTWKTGQTPKLEADLRNRGERNVSMGLAPGNWEVQCDGVWYRSTVVTGGTVGVLNLSPGAQRNGISLQLRDFWGWKSKNRNLALVFRPGKHTVRAAFHLRTGDRPRLRVVSNPVEIEIVAEGPAAGDDQTAWGPAVEGVQCRLLPRKSTWKAGQTPNLKADLRNQGKRRVSMGLAPGSGEVQYDGLWYRSTTVTLGLVLVLNLGPGAQKDGISLQLGDFWGWKSKDKNLALVFRPGRHTLRAAFHLRSDGGDGLRVVSNPVQIEILTDEQRADTQPAENVPFGWVTHAAEGKVKQVACDPALALDGNPVPTRAGGFVAPLEDAGTVHDDAVVAWLGSDRLPIAVAVDSRQADATDRDVLRFDFSGKEQFAGKPVVPLKVSRRWDDSIENVFGPTTIQFKRGHTTIPVTVQGEYCKYGNRRRSLTVEIGAALQWQCRFGEKTHAVRLVDGNANFAFGDRATPNVKDGRVIGVSQHDTLAVDAGDGSFDRQVLKAYYGHPVWVDGVWYHVALSADGTQIAARPLDAQTAQLKIPHPVWSARLAGRKYLLTLSGSTEPVSVPADRYTVLQYRQSTPLDEKERPGWFALTWISDSPGLAGKAIDAAAGKTVEVALGTPLCGRITPEVDGRTVHLDFTVVDASGAAVNRVYLANDWPAANFEILDADGKCVHSGRFGFC